MPKTSHSATVAILLLFGGVASAQTWDRFRGPNGSGVADVAALPAEFGPDRNVLWKTQLPAGHSSPILDAERLYLTAAEGDDLFTIALDRENGDVLWRRPSPRPRAEKLDSRNHPASPSPATDGEVVVVFFPDFGLLAYDTKGEQLWSRALGPFNNIYGMGASPILAGDLVLLACDQSAGSFFIALDRRTGEVRWRMDRPEAKSGHCTPILWRPEGGATQALLPGSFLLTSYAVETGEKLWWVGGLSFEMKSTPVMTADTLYINGYGSPANHPDRTIEVAPFAEMLAALDADGDGRLGRRELPREHGGFWFDACDLDSSGALDETEWDYYRAVRASKNGMLAVTLGGKGEMTATAVQWQYHRAVPQLPSPLLYGGALYMINDAGIATSFDPASGEVIAQGRLPEVTDNFYASPVAGDGKVYFVSETGKVVVLPPGGRFDEAIAVNDMGDLCYATPALAEGRIYLRAGETLYCFGRARDRSGDLDQLDIVNDALARQRMIGVERD